MGIITNIRQYYGDNITEVKAGSVGTGLLIERDGHIIADNDTIHQIKEDIDNGHQFVIPEKMICHAVMQKYDTLNANGRIYPKNVLIPAVDKYIEERVKTRCAISALDHPSSTTLSGHDVAHLITDLQWQGKTLIGEMEIHLSPGYTKYGICSTSGDLVANMLLARYNIGVSSRAVGSVEEKYGTLYVGSDLEIIAFDTVIENSTPGAKMRFDREELSQFIESIDNKTNPLYEKIQRIQNILKS